MSREQSFAASRLACITLRSSSVSLTGDRLRVTRCRKVALAQVGAHRYVAPLVVLRATLFRVAPQTDQTWRSWQVRTFDAGGFRPSKGLKQGFFDGTLFYGEAIFRFIRLARTAALPGGRPAIRPPEPGNSIVPLPTPVEAWPRLPRRHRRARSA